MQYKKYIYFLEDKEIFSVVTMQYLRILQSNKRITKNLFVFFAKCPSEFVFYNLQNS